MPTILFASVPTRPCRTLLMFLGSVVLHGLIIGVASFWPAYPAISKNYPPVDLLPAMLDDRPQLDDLPASTPTTDEPALTPPPTIPDYPAVDDTPLPALDPDPFTPPAPTPVPTIRRSSAPSTPVHTNRALPYSNRIQRDILALTAVAPSGSGTVPGGTHPSSGAGWKTPKPPYPYAMRAARLQGSGTLRITTNPHGQVVEATVIQSCGSPILDENMSRYACGFWSGPPSLTRLILYTYQLP